jgi:photosystem II stability/assembly factor-like uncharacterized protein
MGKTRWARLMIGGFLATGALAAAQTPPALEQLRFRFIGPNGNRDIAVVGVPGNPLVDYFGAASGGIWKTTDGGAHFHQIFDSADVSSVSALAIAPSEPNVIWAGTGETSIIRESTSLGDGVYKSANGGQTWQHMGIGQGLDQTGHISNIAINPHDPNEVFVCALGQAYKPNPQRGVYRTLDGGNTWKLVLKGENEYTGCSGLSLTGKDPQTIFAGMWQVDIKPWDLDSGGAGSGVFVSRDGGDTWDRVAGQGLPPAGAILGKIAVRVAPSDPQRAYALLQANTAELYRSDDGGRNWKLVNESHIMSERSPYFNNFQVAPDNPDLLYFVSVSWSESRDGGYTFTHVTSPGGDSHDVWIDPENPRRILVADDTGGAISLNGGRSYFTVNLPIAQLYHVYADDNIPYNVIGNRQDNDGEEGPSRLPQGGSVIPASAWHAYGGCDNESGFGVPDPADPDIIWSSCYNGDLTRVNLHNGTSRNVAVDPIATYGDAPSAVRNRWNWTFPIAISPHSHNQVYVGSQYVWQTDDGGQSWKKISPDLTTNDKSKEGHSGGVSFDDLGTYDVCTLSMIDESPVRAGVIWAGSYDGQVSVTRDGGTHWTNVTKNIPDLPPWGTINLQASPLAAGTAYISSNRKSLGDYAPYMYKTADYGQTWTSVSGNLPHSEFSFVHIVRQDPVRPGMLYAGTENALYISWDDGSHWTQLRNNLPPAPVYWLQIQPRFSDLVIGTYGRGAWILDDVTPLRSWDQVSAAGQPHLFKPRPAYRFRTTVVEHQDNPNGATVGEDIPYGADLNYYLPAAGEATITIRRGTEVIRTLEQKGGAGLNRIFWDLRHPNHDVITLLTNPPREPWVATPVKGRSLNVWGQPTPDGPKVAPGEFTASLSVNGTTVGSAPLEVLRDPHDVGTQQDMEATETFLVQLQGELHDLAGMIEHFEFLRKQIEVLEQGLGRVPKAPPVLAAARALETQAAGIEGEMFNLESTGSTEDSFRNDSVLYEQLGSLNNNLEDAGADMAPTDAEMEVHKELQSKLAALARRAHDFTTTQVPAFNALAKTHGLTAALQE